MANRWGKVEAVTDFIFLGSKITADCDCSHEIKRDLHLGRKAVRKLDSILESRDITLWKKACLVKAMVFPVVMYWCKSWITKKLRCFWTVVLEEILESPLDSNEIKPVNSKGNELWIFFGRTDAENEAPILWPPDAKSRLIGKDWCWERFSVAGEGGKRGCDSLMASLTKWTWVWAYSGKEWRTGQPGILQSVGSQKVRYDLATEQQ